MKTACQAIVALTLALLLIVPAHAQPGAVRCFPETGHCIAHGFKAFWERNGGLPVFGYPLTDEFAEPNPDTGQIYTVQYFERQRFEYHPENRPPYDVLLGRLGVQALTQQGRDWFTFPKADPSAPHYFPQTGHAIAPEFWDYWRTHGLDLGDRGISTRESIALFGYPVSEAQVENNAGVAVLTQWFERARFEFHPNNPAPFKVLLGRLGAETMPFRTTQPAMLRPHGDASVIPILSVGDTLPNGYRFPSIPDGLGIVPREQGTVDVFVAHETSTAPFPPVGSPGAAADFSNAEISRIRIGQRPISVLSGALVWTSDKNFLRFCSAFMAGAREGFAQPVFFTGEEDNTTVSEPPNPAWPPTGPTRQAGHVVAVDATTGQQYVIPGLGRMNHENTVIVPGGWGRIAAVTTDDTFDAPGAQLYLYLADSPEGLLQDRGQLYAFVSDDPAINDYGDMSVGRSIGGRFIPVPREIALGSQQALEDWSNANNVFQFIRTEDIAYDKNNPRVLYIADTGEPRALPDPATGRLRRGPSGTRGPYPNGRVFMLAFSADDPLRVDSLQILIDADAGGYDNPNVMHNPDNLDTSRDSLMIQEDPISVNNFTPGQGPNARIWRYALSNGTLSIVAEVDQSRDPQARAGAWESSGIVDAAAVFGEGSWLVTVQAHTLWIETAPAEGYTRKREGGQLVLLRVPRS